MTQLIVDARNLVKKYGDFTAVNDVSFTIEEGQVFGLLGPNGAGKSTTISMLTCLFPPSNGSARVGGHDVVQDADQVKQLIGVVPQDLALYPTLSARDNLTFFGEMFGFGGKELKQRVGEVLDYVAMRERADAPVKTLSGGMKRRVNLAVGLINRPRILFLDEPTVGVDPQSRNHIFESVERLNQEQGMAILYTTHYMEEAQRLCHSVGIMDRGEIIALDTPKDLIAMLGGGIIHIGLAQADDSLRSAVVDLPVIKTATFLPPDTPAGGVDEKQVLKVEAIQANEALLQIINLLNKRDVDILSIETLDPNLETVFLHLTGKSLRQ